MMLMACDSERRESDACLHARSNAHAASKAGDLELTKQHLSAAEQECGRASDYDISRLQRFVERETRRQSQRTKLREQPRSPIADFMEWVSSRREEKNRAQGKHQCEPRDSAQFGFCTSEIPGASPDPFVMRYWQAEPEDAVRFSWNAPAQLTCNDAGPHRRLSSWSKEGKQYTLCELSEHDLRGMAVLLTVDGNTTHIDVFTRAYAEHDEDFAEISRAEP